MIITAFIISYVISIFINRQLNYLGIKYFNWDYILGWWFIPVVIPLVFLIDIIDRNLCNTKLVKWFFGKHWKN